MGAATVLVLGAPKWVKTSKNAAVVRTSDVVVKVLNGAVKALNSGSTVSILSKALSCC